jgi:hypothetical protein
MDMSHTTRSLPTTALLSAILAAAALAGVSVPSVAHAGDEKCTTTDFKIAKVKKACADGGRKAAKELMKTAVKKAKDGGNKDVKCTSCHEDTKDFKLKDKDKAVKDLKALLGD